MFEPLRSFEFSGTIWTWRGPAPFFFVTVPEPQSAELNGLMRSVTYGWGMIPATVRVGKSEWTTALWPKDGSYIVPLKAWVRKAERMNEGDTVALVLTVVG